MKHLVELSAVAFSLMVIGVLILVLLFVSPKEDENYTRIEQQKTLQIEAQSKAIQVVADKIPSMWPIVFLSCIGFLSIVVMTWFMYRINVVKSSQINSISQYKEISNRDSPSLLDIEDIEKIRLLIRKYDRYMLERKHDE